MKTTVELPDDLLIATRRYAKEHGKTFKEVLTESLKAVVVQSEESEKRPAWEALFGAFAGDPENQEIQAIIDREFSHIDPEEWR
jgi:hypothetical protein